jgi:WD40 repeat protein
MAFSPSGRQLAIVTRETVRKDAKTASTIYTVLTRSMNPNEPPTLIAHPASPVEGLAFNPDETRLAIAWNKSRPPDNKFLGVVQVWDVPLRKEAYTINLTTGWISGGVTFSPDGKYLACGDPVIRQKVAGVALVWDAQTGKEVATFRGHPYEVTAVAFSPDSRQLVTGGLERTIRIWDVINEPGALTWQGQAIALSPDGKGIATVDIHAAEQPPQMRVTFCDAASGQVRRSVSAALPGPVVRMAYHNDGQRMAAVFVRRNEKQKTLGALVKVWDVATGREEAAFPLDGVTCKLVGNGTGPRIPVAFSQDGRRLAVVGDAAAGKGREAPVVAVWDVATGREVFARPLDLDDVFDVAFRPDRQQLAVVSGRPWDTPLDDASSQPPAGRVKVLEAQTGAELLSFQAQAAGINALAFSPDGQHLATAARDGEVKIWNAATGDAVVSFQDPSHKIWSVAFSPDGQRLATGSGDKTVKLWDPRAGRLVYTLRGPPTGVVMLAFTSDGQRLATAGSDDPPIRENGETTKPGSPGVVKVWDAGGRP